MLAMVTMFWVDESCWEHYLGEIIASRKQIHLTKITKNETCWYQNAMSRKRIQCLH